MLNKEIEDIVLWIWTVTIIMFFIIGSVTLYNMEQETESLRIKDKKIVFDLFDNENNSLPVILDCNSYECSFSGLNDSHYQLDVFDTNDPYGDNRVIDYHFAHNGSFSFRINNFDGFMILSERSAINYVYILETGFIQPVPFNSYLPLIGISGFFSFLIWMLLGIFILDAVIYLKKRIIIRKKNNKRKMELEIRENRLKCITCQNIVEKDSRFCDNCGKKIKYWS